MKKLVFVVLAGIMLLLVSTGAAFATYRTVVQTLILNKSETINHNYYGGAEQVIVDGTVNGDAYVVGSRVEINGTVNGDAYVAGGQTFINGNVTGDLLVAGGQVTVKGNVGQNIRAAGGNVLVLGSVGKNASIAGGNITVDTNKAMLGNVLLLGGNLDLLSGVHNLTVGGGNVNIAGAVTGDVTAGVEKLYLAQNANIAGNLEYWSQNNINLVEGATIAGTTIFHKTEQPRQMRQASKQAAGALTFVFSFVSFISALIIGLLLLWFAPNFSQKTVDLVKTKFWMSLFVGFMALIVIPVVAVILLITFIGFPLAVFIIFSFIFILCISKIFVAVLIGQWIGKKGNWKFNLYVSFVIGLVIYYVIGFIPVLGVLVKLVVLLTGVGALVLRFKEHFQMLREKKLI